ncbi:MAG: energy transducer TonB [Acidobacteria bacterium]|nr:energy transducer TonB [Acidobacteriota bacterium]
MPFVYSVLDALKEWRFKPATLDGRPVEIRYVLTVRFRLVP